MLLNRKTQPRHRRAGIPEMSQVLAGGVTTTPVMTSLLKTTLVGVVLLLAITQETARAHRQAVNALNL